MGSTNTEVLQAPNSTPTQKYYRLAKTNIKNAVAATQREINEVTKRRQDIKR